MSGIGSIYLSNKCRGTKSVGTGHEKSENS